MDSAIGRRLGKLPKFSEFMTSADGRWVGGRVAGCGCVTVYKLYNETLGIKFTLCGLQSDNGYSKQASTFSERDSVTIFFASGFFLDPSSPKPLKITLGTFHMCRCLVETGMVVHLHLQISPRNFFSKKSEISGARVDTDKS